MTIRYIPKKRLRSRVSRPVSNWKNKFQYRSRAFRFKIHAFLKKTSADNLALAAVVTGWLFLTVAVCFAMQSWVVGVGSVGILIFGLVGFKPVIRLFWTGLYGATLELPKKPGDIE